MYNLIIRLLSCLIPSRSFRKRFRRKFIKKSKLEQLETNLKNHIHFLLNTFYDVRNIPEATGQLRKIQLANLVLLSELDKICKENNIQYWLDYGNLLGAYRTGKYVPWDDDMDIGMMRKDFNKLISIISNYPNFKLTEWLHLRNGRDIHCRVAKFCFNRDDIHLFVDIFPYDYCNCIDKEEFYNEYARNKNLLRKELEKLNMPQYSFCECNNEKDLQIINRTFSKYVNKYNSLNDGNTILYGIENPYNKARRIFNKEWIFPIKHIQFEGKNYPIPNNTDKYLTINFGNYMTIPRDVGIAKHPKYTQKEIEKIEEILINYNIKTEY